MYTWQAQELPRPPAAHQRARGLDRVVEAGSILEAIRVTRLAAREAAVAASGSSARSRLAVAALRAQTQQSHDALLAVAAVHALARVPGAAAERALIEALELGHGSLSEHVAWQAALRQPSGSMLDAMIGILIGGRLAGMHAQSALARWATNDPWLVAASLRAALGSDLPAPGRRHVIETLGLVPDRSVAADLRAIARDVGHPEGVREVAMAALSDRRSSPTRLPRVTGPAQGVSVAQVHLGAQLDPQLRRSGMGDTGGVATLLVKLGSALAEQSEITRILTVGRGSTQFAPDAAPRSEQGPRFATVALADDEGTAFTDEWPARVAAERGIRRAFASHGRPDVLHLRMADVGTLAAADVAAAMGIPTVFSLAPDPHAVIAAREAAGTLDRSTFAAEDAAAHLWYRVDLVERLAREADEVVLFPRARLAEDIRDLVGMDVAAQRDRFTVVPEGIDVAHIQRSVAARSAASDAGVGVADAAPSSTALADLLGQVAELPPSRHGLPIVLSVGRLNELKGMARLVEAFAADEVLRSRATLVIVGGDLADPSAAEAAELARIERHLAAQPSLRDAILLLGHRPNDEIADLLGVVRHGASRLVGPGGAYACASRKEEFGLAIVEALAAGLPVVAPIVGGPATYVEDGTTGCLVDTTDPVALARGVAGALDLSDRPGRADRAADTIARRYDISEMARALSAVYSRAANDPRATARPARMAS